MDARPGRAVLVALAALALTAMGQGAAHAAASRPAPVDQGPRVSARLGAAAQMPDQRRSPGLKVLAEQDADRAAEGPALAALCQAGIGKPNPYRNPAPNVDQIHGDTIVPVG